MGSRRLKALSTSTSVTPWRLLRSGTARHTMDIWWLQSVRISLSLGLASQIEQFLSDAEQATILPQILWFYCDDFEDPMCL
mmetsp:Transcript_43198/g.119477  ORF Transcript_43198/g.119477 Transcript_43198/m.119477 type:complete len:81 (+) Transcript_43198:462-704(+)